MANPFVHVELYSPNLAKAKGFYQNLFDWKLEDMPQMDYTMVKVGDGGTGGGMLQRQDMPAHWLPYVLVNDIRAATDKARDLGGTIHKDVTEIPGMGWFSIIADPSGATFGLWQGKGK